MTSSLATAVTKLATAPGATIATVLRGLAGSDHSAVRPAVTLPKDVLVSGDQREALTLLADVVSAASWPTSRRMLSDDELSEFVGMLTHVKAAKAAVLATERALRTTLFNHLDVRLEHDGLVGADTPRDSSGFYLVPVEGDGFSRAYCVGTPVADVEALQALVREGVITRADYLAMTSSVREIDESKLLNFIAKHPEKTSVLRRVVKFVKAASVSLRLG